MIDLDKINQFENTELCIIMNKFKSDKGLKSNSEEYSHHNYSCIYDYLFKNIKNNELRIFELGIGTNNINLKSNMGVNGIPGASLFGWKEYFQNSIIFGADIDKNILFDEDRIKTYYCDQTNPFIIQSMWSDTELSEDFDIIIEDGLHEFWANVIFFENSIHKLKKGGYYIIEDILKNEIILFENKIIEWREIYPYLDIQLLILTDKYNKHDNNLLIFSYN